MKCSKLHILFSLILALGAPSAAFASPQKCALLFDRNSAESRFFARSARSEEALIAEKKIRRQSRALERKFSLGSASLGQTTKTPYDLIIIGSGPHAAIAAATARKSNPNLSILVVSRDMPGAVFRERGHTFYINSAEFSDRSANVLPNSKGQLKDFGSEKFHLAQDLGDHVLLSLAEAKPDFLIDTEASTLRSQTLNLKSKNTKLVEVTTSSDGRTSRLYGKAVVVATGLGIKRYGIQDSESLQTLIRTMGQEETLPRNRTRTFEHFDDFTARIESQLDFGKNPLDAYRGKDVMIVGNGGDGANVILEAFGGYGPPQLYGLNEGSMVPDRPGSIRVGSGPAKVHIQTLGQVFDSAQDFRSKSKGRYHETVPSLLGSIRQIDARADKIRLIRAKDGSQKVEVTDSRGDVHLVDTILFGTGYADNTRSLFLNPQLHALVIPNEKGGTRLLGIVSGDQDRAIVVGPPLGNWLSEKQLNDSITKNPASINVLAPITEDAVRSLLERASLDRP